MLQATFYLHFEHLTHILRRKRPKTRAAPQEPVSTRNIAIAWQGVHDTPMTNHLHKGDLPDTLAFGASVAIDCETMGLVPGRDRLCLVQLSFGDGDVHLVQIAKGQTSAPNLERLVSDPGILKLFHFGRFDIAALYNAFGALAAPV